MYFKKYIIDLFLRDKYKVLFLIDILDMKDINNIYGFKNGDLILKQMLKFLNSTIKSEIKKFLKKNSIIYCRRSYADIFELVINQKISSKEIENIVNLMLKEISKKDFVLINKSHINLNITIGCSLSKDKLTRIYAEKALFEAKSNHINYMYYDSYLYKNEDDNNKFLDIFNYNINNNLVEPYFQAIIDNKTGKIVKYEALIRLFDKNNNTLLPQSFIDKTKKYRLYTKVIEICFNKIIKYIKEYHIHISINFTYSDISNYYVKNTIISKIKEHNIGEYLTFEILESEEISNFELLNEYINELKKLNVKIAIDDFGTGFSNYENILNLNIDYIKIDGSLIKKINEPIYFNLIKSIVYFCKEQNIKIIAEYVKDLKTFRYVKNLNIDYSQGYYIGKAMNIKELIGKNYET